MLRLLVSVLAAASFTQAFDPSSYLNEISTSIKERLHDGKQMVNEKMEKIHIPRIIRDKDLGEDKSNKHHLIGGNDHTCAECTRWVGHHLIQASINETISYCKNTTCPEAKKHCQWIKGHKNFTLGYITQRVEPVRSGRLYCEGKGVCPIHDGGNAVEMLDEDNFFINQDAALDAITSALDDPIDENDSKIEVASATSMDDIVTPFNDFDGDGDDEDDIDINYILADKSIGKKKLCSKCISAVTTHIIKGNLVQVAAFCAKSGKDPKWKARCDFTLSHPDFSSGYLFSKYKPANTGYGYCYAKGACPHSPYAFSQDVEPAQIFDINF